MRVWVDLTNSAHPVVLRPLVELLEAGGHDVELTARPLSQTTELLDDWGHPYEAIARYGARPPKLLQYPGLKEDYYLSGFEADRGVLGELGLDAGRVLCVVRTAPSYALYLGGSENELLKGLFERLAGEEAQTVVLARTDAQRRAVCSLGDFIVPDRAVDARSLIAFADAVVSAGGTMTREAAALGTPVWSIFEGRLGAVDEKLVREGRVKFLRSPDELPLRKVDRRFARPRRDPAELLRLAVPTS